MTKEYICAYLCKYAANGLDTLEKCGECPVKKETEQKAIDMQKIMHNAAFSPQIMPDSSVESSLRAISRELHEINRNLKGLKK